MWRSRVQRWRGGAPARGCHRRVDRLPLTAGDIAAATGGRSLTAPDERSLSSGLSAIATELRRQYLIGYAPAATEQGQGWRSISVKVRKPGLRVRARDGYYAVR